ncbi:hypothetical protein D3C87_1921140 [compost metagenome]
MHEGIQFGNNDRVQRFTCSFLTVDHISEVKGGNFIGPLGDECLLCPGLADKHHGAWAYIIISEYKIHQLFHRLLLQQIS